VNDILMFMSISAVFVLAFTTSFAATMHTHGAGLDDSKAVSPPAVVVWGMFGDFSVDNAVALDATELQLAAPMLWAYVLVSNILLVNLVRG